MHRAFAEEFTAGTVLDRMSFDERASYIAGVVEGLAYARYAADSQSTEGMSCIYSWYYDDSAETIQKVHAAFERYRNHTPGAIIAVLVNRKCGG